jgi:N-acetyl sugar amidotransferase
MQKAIIFGATENGEVVYSTYKDKFDIIGFFDNDLDKQNTMFCGKEVYSPFSEKFQSKILNSDYCIILSCYISYFIIDQIKSFSTMIDVYWFYNGVLYNVYPNSKEVVRCKRCVMDNVSDITIGFNEDGYCDYCTNQLEKKDDIYFPNKTGEEKLQNLVREIKDKNKENEYDCLIGLSGGLDSSYMTYLAYKMGLRCVCVHVDDGLYTSLAMSNIEKLIKTTGFELISIKPDEVQYYALLKAYFKAGVAHLYLPQDNFIHASLYKFAKEKNIHCLLSGYNFAHECIMQRTDEYGELDIVNLRDIHKKFGTEPIDKLSLMTGPEFVHYKKILGIDTFAPLNYIDYNRKQVLKDLYDFCGYEHSGGKHLENVITAFNILYWCPKKFNLDLRTNYFSSLIVSGQLEREEAIRLLEEPLYDEKMMKECIDVIKSKLKISDIEFDDMMAGKAKRHYDYETESPSPDTHSDLLLTNLEY